MVADRRPGKKAVWLFEGATRYHHLSSLLGDRRDVLRVEECVEPFLVWAISRKYRNRKAAAIVRFFSARIFDTLQ